MKKHTLSIIAILLFSTSSFAGFQTKTYDNYTDVFKFFQSEVGENGAESLLVVFDIDRTVLDTVDCLDPSQEFSNGFFRFEAKVWNCHGVITSPILPALIGHLKRQSIPVMALTARRAQILEPTLEQLTERLWFSEEVQAEMSVTFETAPLYSEDSMLLEFEQQGASSMLQKSLMIKKGVAMASGANKGVGLQAFTDLVEKESGECYDRIIFVDDDIDNIRDLEEAYADKDQFISIIHYTEHVED